MATVQKLPTSDYQLTNWLRGGPGGTTEYYICVDDTIGEATDAYYVRTSITGTTTILFGFDALNIPSNATNIVVKMVMLAQQSGSTPQQSIAGAIKIGANTYSGDMQGLTSSQASYTTTWNTDPSTSSAWTYSGVNDIDYIGTTGTGQIINTTSYQTYLWRIYLQVEYDEITDKAFATSGVGVVIGSKSVSVG